MKIKFDINLSKWQRKAWKLLHDPTVNELVLCCSRQCGKSIFAEIAMMEAALTNPNANVCYISPLYTQGKKVYREICDALEKANLIKRKNSSNLTIELVNNSLIQFFTAQTPTAIRGTTCSYLLVLDEFAYFPEETTNGENLFHNVIKPITKTRKPKILYLSTPNGKQNTYYQKYLEGLEGKKTRTLVNDIYKDPFISLEEIEELKRSTPPLAWAQEYEVKFLDNALTAFEGFEDCFKTPNKQNGRVWVGIDLSSVGEDETVMTMIDKEGNTRQKVIEGTLDEKYHKIADTLNKLDFAACYVETNGIGEVMLNEIKKLTRQKNRLYGWNTSSTSKNEIISLLQTEIANKSIAFDIDDKQLYIQFGVFTYTVDKRTRRISYAAKPPYHDDRIMSLAIALRCRLDYPSNGLNNYATVAMKNRRIN